MGSNISVNMPPPVPYKEIEHAQETALKTRQYIINCAQLQHVPTRVFNLDALKTLDLAHNRICALPADVWKLSRLRYLRLADNMLGALPEEIGHLLLLKKVDVSNNIIDHIPSTIGACAQIHTLLLNDNRLSSLPAEISKLDLTVFDISHNSISTLPVDWGRLGKLAEFKLNDNDVETVPREYGNMTSLLRIDMRNNKVKTLPMELMKHTPLVIMYTEGNPVHDVVDSLNGFDSFSRRRLDRIRRKHEVWPPKPSSTDIKGWGDDADLDGEF